MRTIKYRAYLKREKVMLPVINLDFDYKGKGVLVDVITVNPSGNPEADPWENNLEDVELMQFTTRHDKNGTEIYDGDIIEFKMVYLYSDTPSKRIKGIIAFGIIDDYEYNITTLGWRINDKDGGMVCGLLFADLENTGKVLGNIWENGDLIK